MKRLCGFTLTEAEERVLLNCFGDSLNAVGFIQLLENVQNKLNAEFEKVTKLYIVNDSPVTRAIALENKGKIELVSELIQLVKPDKE